MLKAFLLGWSEAHGDVGMTYGNRRDEAYDSGRELHRRWYLFGECVGIYRNRIATGRY
jgi:hypothetical protein